jgi:hypothetical protein
MEAAGTAVTARTALETLSSEIRGLRRLRAAARRLERTASLKESRSRSSVEGAT